MATIQILDKQTISGSKYPLKKIKFEKPDLDGKMHDEEIEVYYRPDAVGVLMVDEKKEKILLTRQFRMPAFLNGSESGYLVEACAGLIDETETPEQAMRREVIEETGYTVDSFEKIAGVYSSAGGITEFLHLYIARFDSTAAREKGGGLAAENEAVENLALTFEEAKEKLKRGEIRDAKTLILLQHYFLS
jgi:nudix-type nucleoside diphosphatase (YffH/AdpP family)